MKYVFVIAGIAVLAVAAYVLTRKPARVPDVKSTYNGGPNDYQGGKILLVAVYAKWASVWLATAEVLANVDTQKYDILLVDADKEPDTVKQLAVTIIPTVIVYDDGKEIARVPNMMNAEQLPE